MSVMLDPQLAGILDDGTPEGVLRAKLVRGNLVRVPFLTGYYQTEVTGGATATLGLGLTSLPTTDGYQGSLTVATPADVAHAASAGVVIWVPFRGRAFGVRWRRQLSLTNIPDFSVFIDGVAYAVPAMDTRLANEGLTAITDEGMAVLTDDLPEGTHLAQIVVNSRTLAQNIVFYGLLLEERAGYRPMPVVAVPLAKTTITTSMVTIYQTTTSTNFPFLRRVDYVNISASPVTVTIDDSANIVWQASLAALGSAGCTASWDPGTWFRPILFRHQASAGSAVNAIPWGGAYG